MNIFVLDENPSVAAQMHCDKHIAKMVVESAQMLSTAHRMLDGNETKRPSKSGKRMVKYWKHPDNNMEQTLYKAVHMNHPCTVWTRESRCNYVWHYELFCELAKEYTYRYGKQHKSFQQLEYILAQSPNNIPDIGQTPYRLAMGDQPQCIDVTNPVDSYRHFYMTKQDRFKMVWTGRKQPNWFKYK